MNNSKKIKKMVGIASLIALSTVFQIIANYLPPIGNVSINLALIPILMGAVIFGPISGGAIGLVVGVVVLFASSTQTFLALNGLVTVILCLLKTSLAGYLSGLAYSLLKKKNNIIALTSSAVILPVVNTSLFLIACVFIFEFNLYNLLISGAVLVNFGVELLINILLVPTLMYVIKTLEKQFN